MYKTLSPASLLSRVARSRFASSCSVLKMAAPTTNSSKSSFGQAIHFITDIKLQELETQRLAYKEHAKILDTAKAIGETGDIIKKVETLAKAIKSWTGSGAVTNEKVIGARLQLDDLEFWLQQANKDPSFSREIAEGWADTLEQHIRHTVMRFDAARLFGMLFNEWLASGDSSAVAYQGPSDDPDLKDVSDAESTAGSSFIEVGRKEMYEQKEKLLSIVFNDRPIDAEKLTAYLEGLFESEEAARSLEKLRKEMKDFSYWLKRKTITVVDVRHAITGLLASGLMDEEKRATLKAFQDNNMVLNEVASVLNMRMANLKSWSWPKEGILVEFRRHLNGKYRAFTDPEIIDAILLHHIGVVWQVKLKGALRRIFDSKAWIRPSPPAGKDRDRWTEQLRGDKGEISIDAVRNGTRRGDFFMSQLQESAQNASSYDDLVDAPDQSGYDGMSPADIKRQLLHIMTTECYLNQVLHGSHAVVCSDLEWFGPSLPHTSIIAVLEFFGISKTWLGFFKAFLAAPIRFPGETKPRVRKRGTPISYSLSVFCGEAILSMMDFAVNQRANGLFLYRMHDDLWIWGSDPKKVADGWHEMNKYATLVGLTFGKPKTGSSYVGAVNESTSRLPSGDIRWGFLQFDPDKARFVIDQKDVDMHIKEMRRQLVGTKSVFGWVNAYNKYMTFFMRNFGGLPGNCVGKDHVLDMIDTLARIQRELFPEMADGGAVGYLRKTIKERFGTTDLPEGYFYFPISSGGLQLRNTMLELLALDRRDKPLTTLDDDKTEGKDETSDAPTSASSLTDDEPDSDDESEPDNTGTDDDQIFHEDKAVADVKFKKRIEHDRKVYESMKEAWELDTDNRRSKKGHLFRDVAFMSFDEYVGLRETWLSGWGQSYSHMLQPPKLRQVTLMPEIRELTKSWAGWEGGLGWYGKWVVNMYGEEVVRKFGGLEVVDPNLIPIGMVQLFKTSRMKLDQ